MPGVLSTITVALRLLRKESQPQTPAMLHAVTTTRPVHWTSCTGSRQTASGSVSWIQGAFPRENRTGKADYTPGFHLQPFHLKESLGWVCKRHFKDSATLLTNSPKLGMKKSGSQLMESQTILSQLRLVPWCMISTVILYPQAKFVFSQWLDSKPLCCSAGDRAGSNVGSFLLYELLQLTDGADERVQTPFQPRHLHQPWSEGWLNISHQKFFQPKIGGLF